MGLGRPGANPGKNLLLFNPSTYLQMLVFTSTELLDERLRRFPFFFAARFTAKFICMHGNAPPVHLWQTEPIDVQCCSYANSESNPDLVNSLQQR